MDIDAMEAGRELDVLVAERVMGKDITRARDEYGDLRIWWLDAYKCEDTLYSTDIAAAWKVVGKLIADGMTYFFLECDGGIHWQATFSRFTVDFPVGHDSDHVHYMGDGDDAPSAICRAALKAVAAD